MLLEGLVKLSEALHSVLVVLDLGHLYVERDRHEVVEVLSETLTVTLHHVEKLVLFRQKMLTL